MVRANSYVCDLSVYQPGLTIEQVARQYGHKTDQIIKLASNENPFGASPSVLKVLNVAARQVHRYPEQYMLVQALADHYAVDPENIVLGNGSNDILDVIARVYLSSGRSAVSSQYAFAVYQMATHAVGADNIIVPSQSYGHDLNAIAGAIRATTNVVWIANPNNPTGTYIAQDQMHSFLRDIPDHVIVVLDEAYAEYLTHDNQAETARLLATFPNLIIVRTFSKIYGLAGLRVGYAITDRKIAELLNRIRQPFNVNGMAVAAASAALNDQEFVRKSCAHNDKNRRLICAGLDSMGLLHLPAFGNFVTFQVHNALRVAEALLQQAVIVRPLQSYGMGGWLRVTVGTPAQSTYFLSALRRAILDVETRGESDET